MRFTEFDPKINLLESNGLFGRMPGDAFTHNDGRTYHFVDVAAFPDAQQSRFESPEARDEAIRQVQAANLNAEIEWVNLPTSKSLAFAIARLDDLDGGHVFWGRYLEKTKAVMVGTWSNKQVPAGWQLQKAGALKVQAGYDPQHLIATERLFTGVNDIIKTVETNSPSEVKEIFNQALVSLSQGNAQVSFPDMYGNMKAIRDYFGEIMQPVALMGNVIGGQAEDARKLLADGARWDQCQVMWPMAMNEALCDSYFIAPNGVKIGISTKGGKGADPSASNLADALEKARKENNQQILDNSEFTASVVDVIAKYSAKQGPIELGKMFNLPGIDDNLLQEIEGYIKQGKTDLNGISQAAQQILAPYKVVLTTVGFNTGFAILSGVAKTVSEKVNQNPEFSKGALALLNQSSMIQVYTKMGKRGNDAVLNGFEAVYPPNFEGKILMTGGKNYYSTNVKGKLSFGWDKKQM